MRRRAERLAAAAALALAAGCASAPRTSGWDTLTTREHLALARSYEERGERESARRQYEDALAHNPDDPEALLSLGNVEYVAGRFAAAEKLFRGALRADRSNGRAMNNLAMALLSQGKRLEEAESLARRAAADPKAKEYAEDTLKKIREARDGQASAKDAERRL